ncbi:diacylglycerol kinase family protein [Collinsella vaginalis]|uniref:diacylglycerol kinase family protein n=1 Tax=Collinsella vaginalis TaxID=1870987 RepID=UPI0011802FBD|nr:diacylglycerol kinase family protein [Collinsella vaginalis]
MRCLIIHNPASGPRSDEIFAFTHALAEAGDEVVFRLLGDGMESAGAAADAGSFDRVVVSGGDGTVGHKSRRSRAQISRGSHACGTAGRAAARCSSRRRRRRSGPPR